MTSRGFLRGLFGEGADVLVMALVVCYWAICQLLSGWDLWCLKRTSLLAFVLTGSYRTGEVYKERSTHVTACCIPEKSSFCSRETNLRKKKWNLSPGAWCKASLLSRVSPQSFHRACVWSREMLALCCVAAGWFPVPLERGLCWKPNSNKNLPVSKPEPAFLKAYMHIHCFWHGLCAGVQEQISPWTRCNVCGRSTSALHTRALWVSARPKRYPLVQDPAVG